MPTLNWVYRLNDSYDRLKEPRRFLTFIGLMLPVICIPNSRIELLVLMLIINFRLAALWRTRIYAWAIWLNFATSIGGIIYLLVK